ncbi:MAG: glycosyltransferase family 1 protein [bacterium]
MKKVWNIAFEISPILAASGSFGDRSGVYRINYNLIKYLSEYFVAEKLPHQIYVYTLNPALNYNIGLDLNALLGKSNIHFLKIPYPHGKYLQEYQIFDHAGIRFIIKWIDQVIWRPIIENVVFARYLYLISQEFKAKQVKVVHHSESGFAYIKNVLNIIHIHDMVPFMFPFWQRPVTIDIHRRKIKFATKKCNAVICISKHTVKDFVEYAKQYKLPCPPHRVIYLGPEQFPPGDKNNISDINNSLRASGRRIILPKKYFLFFGTIEPRKNTTMLISVFDKLKKAGKLAQFDLVLVGGKGWGKVYDNTKDYLQENYPKSIASPIILLDFLSDEYLHTLITNSYAVVYPSFYEGFGLPVLESMQYGIPVITSNNSSIPEVGEDACLYIDPTSPDSLEGALLTLASSPKLHKQLALASKRQAAKFNWQYTAFQTYQYYCELLKPKPTSSIFH